MLETDRQTDRQTEHELTGYPSKDKPWLQYFTDEQINELTPATSVYHYMYENNRKYSETVAIEYLGKKYTYKSLLKLIDKTVFAFCHYGVKKGDIVTICSITTPEIIASFFALNKLGAISNMIDLRYTPEAIKKYLLEAESEILITLDLCYPLVKNILEETNVKKVIIVSPTEGASFPVKVISKVKKKAIPYGDLYVKWKTFISSGTFTIDAASYEKNMPALMVHTGGTTGEPKGVLLSNENILNAAIQIKNANSHCRRGWRFLNIMPPFIAYGIVLGISIPISLGWHTVVIPKFDASQFESLLMKHKPNGVMGVPIYWENIMNSPRADKIRLGYIEDILIGGDKIPEEFEIRLNQFLSNHNCKAAVGKGYSMTEVSSCTTFSSYKADRTGSVGVPLTKTCVAAFEPGTTHEQPYGVQGELCIKTPTMMLGYYKNADATNEVVWEHPDGKWVHTGDIGYVDEDGFIYVVDRIKRIIPRSGYKVFPSEIEKLFLQHKAVLQCVVVAVPDKKDVSAPMAHIVLKSNYKNQAEQIKGELVELFKKSALPPYFEPVGYKFRDDIPLTKIGKFDYRRLQMEDTEKLK